MLVTLVDLRPLAAPKAAFAAAPTASPPPPASVAAGGFAPAVLGARLVAPATVGAGAFPGPISPGLPAAAAGCTTLAALGSGLTLR